MLQEIGIVQADQVDPCVVAARQDIDTTVVNDLSVLDRVLISSEEAVLDLFEAEVETTNVVVEWLG